MRGMILAAAIATVLAAPAAAHIPGHCKEQGGAALAAGLEEMRILHAEVEAALVAGATDFTISLMTFRLVRTDKRVLASLSEWFTCVTAAD